MSFARRVPARGAAMCTAAVLAVVGLTGCAHARPKGARTDPASATAPGIAVRANGTAQLASVPWVDVPSAVIAWVGAHSAQPSEGRVTAGGETWAVLTSGRQPTAIQLYPLLVDRDSTGLAAVEVALAPGPARAGGAHTALAVALPSDLTGVTFTLHLLGGSQGTPLGPLPADTCAGGVATAAEWEGCAAQLGLRGAQWADAGQGRVRATLGGQVLLLGPQGQAGGAGVTWSGPA